MANKFAEFIDKNKIDPRRIQLASRQLERLRFEDRSLKLARRNNKVEGAEKKEIAKPRSGRVVTGRLLELATSGAAVSGAAKTRLLRAVNRVLEQKKQKPAELKALF
jgi:hypothetical protein